MPLLFKTPEPRNQIKMVSLESLIPLDSEVRLLDEMVDSFFEKNDMNAISGIQNARTVSSAFSPKEMLKLLMYGYRNHINSSRHLEAATYNNIEVMFLLGSLHPSYHTIASFRAANKDLFESFSHMFGIQSLFYVLKSQLQRLLTRQSLRLTRPKQGFRNIGTNCVRHSQILMLI